MTTPDDKTLDELVDRIVGLQLERSSHDDIWQALRDSGDAIAALRAESADLQADLDSCRSALRAASRAAEVTPPAAAPPAPAADRLP